MTISRQGPVVGFVTFACVVCLFIPASFTRADVTGTVTIQGDTNSQDETFYAKSSGCGESPNRRTENWKIGPKGELADVVIWVVDPKFSPVMENPVPEIELKQHGCQYIPHVLAVQAGVPFKIINADPTLHNVHAREYDGPGQPPGPDIFNFGQLPGQSDDRQFDQPGIYTLNCDVHAWMQCWVRALPNPCFAVTALDGSFTLRVGGELADGDYKIDAWHPRFADPLEQVIHVKNGTAQAKFQFDGTKSF